MIEERQRPTKERLRQARGESERVVLEHVDAKGVKETITTHRMLDGHQLERLLSYSAITGEQYQAGVRIYADWYGGGFAASGVIDMEKPVVDNSPKADPTAQLAARTAYAKAIQAIGIVHSHVITNVVLLEQPLADYGRAYHKQSDGKLAKLAATVSLKNALDALDLHYNGSRRQSYRAAAASDYRPTIAGRKAS